MTEQKPTVKVDTGYANIQLVHRDEHEKAISALRTRIDDVQRHAIVSLVLIFLVASFFALIM